MLAVLTHARELGPARVAARSDSRLLIAHVDGERHIRNPRLPALEADIADRRMRIGTVIFEWIPLSSGSPGLPDGAPVKARHSIKKILKGGSARSTTGRAPRAVAASSSLVFRPPLDLGTEPQLDPALAEVENSWVEPLCLGGRESTLGDHGGRWPQEVDGRPHRRLRSSEGDCDVSEFRCAAAVRTLCRCRW
jgi:hypothetical protein